MDTEKSYQKFWDAILKEQEAELAQVDAEEKMKRTNVLEEMKKQFDATTDWTEAKWEQFTAKISQWANED